MPISKQITLALCTLCVVLLLGGYFYFAINAQQDELAEPFQPIFPDDPEMHAAYEKAQDSLDYFLELAANPPEDTQGFAVKARLRENDRQEIFWIYPFDHEGDLFAGRLNDKPQTLLRTYQGDIVEFDRRDIVDWTFDDTRLDLMRGNYTGCVDLIRKAPDNADQFQALFGLDCEK